MKKVILFLLLAALSYSQDEGVRIGAWNMRWFPSGYPVTNIAKRNPQREYTRIDSAARFIAREGIDILMVEEMRSKEVCEQLLAIDALQGWCVNSCTAFTSPPDAAVPPHQNAIISRYKEIDSGYQRWRGEKDIIPPRGYVWAVFDFTNSITAVIGVHLKSNYIDKNHPEPQKAPLINRQMREISSRELIAFSNILKERKYGNRKIDNIIIAGDFNTSILDDTFKEETTLPSLLNAGFKDVFDGVINRMTMPKTKKYPAACFDYLLLHGDAEILAPVVSAKQKLSDHQMISAVFKVNTLISSLKTKESKMQNTPLNVLAIGNSFSISALKYAPQIASTLGVKLNLASICIGGCSLERHANNVSAFNEDPAFHPYLVTWNYASLPSNALPPFITATSSVTNENGFVTYHSNITPILKSEKWDIVTIQQASHESWKTDSYHPHVDKLIEEIRTYAPQAKIVIQQTWSYSKLDPRIYSLETKGPGTWGFDQTKMYELLTENYENLSKEYNLEIIPTGKTVQLYRSHIKGKPIEDDVVGRTWTNEDGSNGCDSIHLNSKGEYLQGCVWIEKLFGVDVRTISEDPSDSTLPGTPEERALLRECVHATVSGE